MAETKQALDNKAQIQAVVDEWFNAARTKNLEKLMTLYSNDPELYGLTPPLVQDKQQLRDILKQWFDGIDSGKDFDHKDTKITASDTVAFCSGLCCAPLPGEQKGSKIWMRFTTGFEKRGDKWVATHEHVSVPFRMETGQASLDLEPIAN